MVHIPVNPDDGKNDDDGGKGGEGVSVGVDRVGFEAKDDAGDEEGLDYDSKP